MWKITLSLIVIFATIVCYAIGIKSKNDSFFFIGLGLCLAGWILTIWRVIELKRGQHKKQ